MINPALKREADVGERHEETPLRPDRLDDFTDKRVFAKT